MVCIVKLTTYPNRSTQGLGAPETRPIAPAFYQTTWFAVSSLLCVFAILYLSYLFRMRHVTSHRRLSKVSWNAWPSESALLETSTTAFFKASRVCSCTSTLGPLDSKRMNQQRAIFVEALRKSDQVMLEGRELVLDLRASTRDKLDLPATIADFGDDFGKSFPSTFTMVVTGQAQVLHAMCAEELYRIAREALYNAFRHADAERIEAELDYDPAFLNLTIRDDGRGIDEEVLQSGARHGHWGLPGMQERARTLGAKIVVRSKRNGGTEVAVSVPAPMAYAEFEPRITLTWLKAFLARWHFSKEVTNG